MSFKSVSLEVVTRTNNWADGTQMLEREMKVGGQRLNVCMLIEISLAEWEAGDEDVPENPRINWRQGSPCLCFNWWSKCLKMAENEINQGRVVQKAISVNPGLKFNRLFILVCSAWQVKLKLSKAKHFIVCMISEQKFSNYLCLHRYQFCPQNFH